MVKTLGVITEQWDNAKRVHRPQERIKGQKCFINENEITRNTSRYSHKGKSTIRDKKDRTEENVTTTKR